MHFGGLPHHFCQAYFQCPHLLARLCVRDHPLLTWVKRGWEERTGGKFSRERERVARERERVAREKELLNDVKKGTYNLRRTIFRITNLLGLNCS